MVFLLDFTITIKPNLCMNNFETAKTVGLIGGGFFWNWLFDTDNSLVLAVCGSLSNSGGG